MSHDEIFLLHQKLEENHKDVMEVIGSLEKKIDPVYELYTDAKGTSKVIKWMFGIILGIASLIGAIKIIIHYR